MSKKSEVNQKTKANNTFLDLMFLNLRLVGLEFVGFLRFILNPWLLVFTGISLFLFTLPIPTDTFSQKVLTFAVAISTGLLGGILAKRWDDIIRDSEIQSRGVTAIRNLKNIRYDIIALRERTEGLQSEDSKVDAFFPEAIDRLNLTEKHLVSSIYDWQDLLPEQVRMFQHAEEIEELRKTIFDKTDQIEALDSNNEANREKIARLEKEKEALEGKLFEQQIRIGVPNTYIMPSGLMTGGTIGSTDQFIISPTTHTIAFGDINSPKSRNKSK